MPKILLIDDNQEILDANASYLSKNGFSITTADSGLKAASLIASRSFDCIVLDILLPDLDGYAICKAARTVTDAPILFLSCLDEIDEKTRGLMLGGDDYMTKPYSLRELAARIRVLVRRGGRSEGPGGTSGADFHIDRVQRLIYTKHQSAILSKKEFELFLFFYDNPGALLSREAILEAVWKGEEANVRTLTTLVARLRKKIAFTEAWIGQIENAYGNGYRLAPPVLRTKRAGARRTRKTEERTK